MPFLRSQLRLQPQCDLVRLNPRESAGAEDYRSTFKGSEHPEQVVVMGAHYDSRGTFGHVRAPGRSNSASDA